MGTPGDKTKIGEVVRGGQLDSNQNNRSEAPPDQPTTTAPETTTLQAAPTMGFGNQFDSFSTANLQPSLPHAAIKLEPFSTQLEQAHIEDYFTQTKYYPSVSENLNYQPIDQPTTSKTFHNLDAQPGPSGLQPATPRQRPPKLNAKRPKKPAQSLLQLELQRKLFACPICQKGFSSPERLGKHQQAHSGQSPYKCDNCKKAFTSKFKLVRHVLIHSDRKPFSCTVCERTFHRKDHLKNHIKVHSPRKEVHICQKPDCKKEYTSLMSFRKHLALHAAEDGSLQCKICQSEFATKEEILYHLKIHAGSRTVKNPSDKKFSCDKCTRKFFTKKDVRRHLVVHTGMRDFLCQFCPQRFGRKDHLVRHIKKSHSRNVRGYEAAIKAEAAETAVKPEPDLSENSLSNELGFQFDGALLPFLQADAEFGLPSTSAAGEALAGSLFEEILGEGGESLAGSEILGQVLSPELLLVNPSEQKKPLPGFSQTFQSPPPPP